MRRKGKDAGVESFSLPEVALNFFSFSAQSGFLCQTLGGDVKGLIKSCRLPRPWHGLQPTMHDMPPEMEGSMMKLFWTFHLWPFLIGRV